MHGLENIKEMLLGSNHQTKATAKSAVIKNRNVSYESFAKLNQDTGGFHSFNANAPKRNQNASALSSCP